jgi:two-component system, OmpR family, sensor kinase
MTFRSRLVVATSALSVATLGLSFGSVYVAVNRSQERQLDGAILAEAAEEADEAAAAGGDRLVISDGPGPTANDVGPLTKYGVIFDRAGAARAFTRTFHDGPPAYRAIAHPLRAPFDTQLGAERLRAVLVPIPRQEGFSLLLAAPRADLDGDAAFIGRAMMLVFGLATLWSVALTGAVVKRLTREHQHIAAVALQVAEGDLSARVQVHARDPEIARLADNVNHMVEQLQQLLDAQRLFVSHAAHELRSPIATIYARLSLALRRPRDPAEYRATIEETAEAMKGLSALAEDLLRLASTAADDRADAGPTPVARAVREAIRLVDDEAAARGVQILVSDADDVHVVGRPRDLERLLRNLLENAVRHSPEGGRVRLAVASRDRTVEIAVTDEGEGVPAHHRAHIFEPFFRGDRERAHGERGAGLGLAIAREIARHHGGDLALDGAFEGGARFVATLPALARA